MRRLKLSYGLLGSCAGGVELLGGIVVEEFEDAVLGDRIVVVGGVGELQNDGPAGELARVDCVCL